MTGPVFIPDPDALGSGIATARPSSVRCPDCRALPGFVCLRSAARRGEPHEARQAAAVLAVLAEVGVPVILAHPDRDALRALHKPETVTGLLCEESCECAECEAGGCEACVDGLGHTNMVCVHCYGADQDGYASRMIWPCETAALLTEDGTR